MLSEETYRANYYQVESDDGRYFYYKAKSTNICATPALIREYHELDTFEFSDEEMYRRMHNIERELNRRGEKLVEI